MQAKIAPAWGGRTERAGDPNQRDADDREAEAARVGARVGALFGGARGEREVSSGRVDPAWRDLERAIDAGFRPPADTISSDSRLVALARQLGNAATGGPTPRGVDPSRAAEPGVFIAEQIAASQRAFAEPGEWRTITARPTIRAPASTARSRAPNAIRRKTTTPPGPRSRRRAPLRS